MANYRRVAYEDRCQIQAFLQAKIDIPQISQRLGFHRSTIYRELSRVRRTYTALRAHQLSISRRLSCRRRKIIRGVLARRVVEKLEQGWSPQEVSARIDQERKGQVSHQSIYDFIYKDRRDLRVHLRRYNRRGAGRLRQRKTRLTVDKRWIDHRPKVAEQRSRIGDWERDTMYCANRKLLLVCTDRKSRFTKLAKLKDYRIKRASKETMRVLRVAKGPVHTITNDNGPEFRDGPNMKVPVYYCSPMKPHQRGTVENTIGLLRQYIKRTTPHRALSHRRLRRIEHRLNHRPRRCLDFRTPYEVFYGKRVALVT